jgi:hypothetical protein
MKEESKEMKRKEKKRKEKELYLLHMIGRVFLVESPAGVREPWTSVKYVL